MGQAIVGIKSNRMKLLLALTFSTLCWVGEGKHRLMKRSAQWNVNIVAPPPPVTLPPLIDPGYYPDVPECPDWYGSWIPFRSGKLDIPVAEENPAEDEVTAAVKSPKEKAEEGSPISEVGQEDSVNQDLCISSPCKNGGKCVATGTSDVICVCKSGTSGIYCEKGGAFSGKDPCSSNPCQNGGKCFSSRDHMSCVCKSGYGGKYCEAESAVSGKDPCSPNPCQNGGKCSSSGSKMSCVCKSGYGGKYCEAEPECTKDGDTFLRGSGGMWNWIPVDCSRCCSETCSVMGWGALAGIARCFPKGAAPVDLRAGAKEESASKSPKGDTVADSAGAPSAGAKENSASKSSKGDTAADSAGAPSGGAKAFRSHLDFLPPIPTLPPTTTTSESGPVKVQVKVHASDK